MPVGYLRVFPHEIGRSSLLPLSGTAFSDHAYSSITLRAAGRSVDFKAFNLLSMPSNDTSIKTGSAGASPQPPLFADDLQCARS